MKIITASKFYYKRAGLESYLFKISQALESNGHEVIPFSTDFKKNLSSQYEKYFAEYIDLSGSETISLEKKLKAFARIIYNNEAASKFANLLDETKPDLVWGFGVHRHLSPSIFIEAKKRNIPVVHRLSDYSIICPNAKLKRGNSQLCSELKCPLKGYHNAIIHNCVAVSRTDNPTKKTSINASIVGALELFIHHNFNLYKNNVNTFIAPSNFLRNVMIKSGISGHQITHIPIFIDSSDYTPSFTSFPYFVYFGRLSEEKGLSLLLEVMETLKTYQLVIIGDGPQKKEVENHIARKNLTNVRLLEKKGGEELHKLIRNSRFVVVPSTWFDNSPNVILESYALGKPVIGANIGGIPEYIKDGETGMLYKYDDKEELAQKIDFLINQPTICEEMGKCAHDKVIEEYNPVKHYQMVHNVLNKFSESEKII